MNRKGHFNPRRMLVAAVAAVALVATTGVAIAASATSPARANAAQSPGTLATVAAFAAFRTPSSDEAGQSRLRATVAGVGAPTVTAATADFALARSADVVGSSQHVWIAPTPDDQICVYIEDPVDGYGASCDSLADLRKGQAAPTILAGGPTLSESAIVAIPVPDGGAAPVIVQEDGGKRALKVVNNVAAALLPADDQVVNGSTTIDLSTLVHPPKPVAVGSK